VRGFGQETSPYEDGSGQETSPNREGFGQETSPNKISEDLIQQCVERRSPSDS